MAKQFTFDQMAALIALRATKSWKRMNDPCREQIRIEARKVADKHNWHPSALFAAALWKAEDLYKLAA